jgi:hypothetical protein
MIRWLKTSNNGIAESKSGNNHTSWWNTDIATYAAYCGEEEIFRDCVDFFRQSLIPGRCLRRGRCRGNRADALAALFTVQHGGALADVRACLAEGRRPVELEDAGRPRHGGRHIVPASVSRQHLHLAARQITGDIIDDQICCNTRRCALGWTRASPLTTAAPDRYLIREQTPLGPLALLEGFEAQYSQRSSPWL